MRMAVINTLKALYEGEEVTAHKALFLGTTRVSNEIGIIKHVLGVDIVMERVPTVNRKWYGRYKIVGTTENLEKAQVILEQYTQKDEV